MREILFWYESYKWIRQEVSEFPEVCLVFIVDRWGYWGDQSKDCLSNGGCFSSVLCGKKVFCIFARFPTSNLILLLVSEKMSYWFKLELDMNYLPKTFVTSSRHYEIIYPTIFTHHSHRLNKPKLHTIFDWKSSNIWADRAIIAYFCLILRLCFPKKIVFKLIVVNSIALIAVLIILFYIVKIHVFIISCRSKAAQNVTLREIIQHSINKVISKMSSTG